MCCSFIVTKRSVFLPAGNRILTLGEVPKDQVYGVKLKGVSVCFAMLKAVLSGNYVNFGVFRLYGDDALDNALQTFIKLLLSIPHSDLLVPSPSVQTVKYSESPVCWCVCRSSVSVLVQCVCVGPVCVCRSSVCVLVHCVCAGPVQ